MADMNETLRHDLRDAEFAEGYAESFLDAYIATQIKVLREESDLTQSEFADLLGTKQTVISRAENVNYSSWNIKTLKKMARVLGVRLRVSFETYGSLIEEAVHFSRESLQRVSRDKDPVLYGEPKLESASYVFLNAPRPRSAGNNNVVFIDEPARRRERLSRTDEAAHREDSKPVIPALAMDPQQGAKNGTIGNFAR